ncbi:MAG TPA: ABC transporter substrate-binding protein [Alphaproteobacteria bacterium]|nr:ABC transporter substrate-binding protein [Alphaproteobacteria bacterium]
MRTQNKIFGLIAGAVALALGVSTPAAAETLTIGIVSATTGPLAAPGKFQLNGFKLAAEEVNSNGGVAIGGKTYKVELKIYDTHCNAAAGASAMQRLASVDRVPVVLGELCSSVAAAEAPIAKDFKVPLILTVPTGPSLTRGGNPYLFRVNSHAALLNKGLSAFMAAKGWSPIAYIAWNNDAGRGGVRTLGAQLPKSIKNAYTGYFNVGEVNFSSHISNIRAKDAKAVVLLMDEEPGSLAIKQIRASGLKIQLIGTLAMGSNRFLKRLDKKTIAGMVQYSAFPPKADVPRIKNFSSRYEKKYGEEAHGFAAQSYDGLMIALAAMQKAGTVSDRTKIRDALAKIDYTGVMGRIKFDAKGQASPPVYITEWCANGTRKILAPAAATAGCGSG